MRRTTWIAVGVTVAVLGGSGLVPPTSARPLIENAVLAFLVLGATAVLYMSFPAPARQAIRGEIRRGRPMIAIARRHRWAVDAVRALADGKAAPETAARRGGRLFRFPGRSRRLRLGASGARSC